MAAGRELKGAERYAEGADGDEHVGEEVDEGHEDDDRHESDDLGQLGDVVLFAGLGIVQHAEGSHTHQ